MALIRVGMAEIKLGTPGDTLQALGLGSCIGLALVDRVSHVGGMAHIMLPDSTLARNSNPLPGKFADTAVPSLLDEVLAAGAVRTRLVVKMAGGAEMFRFAGKDAPKLAIGSRNIEHVHEQLNQNNLKLSAEDVGGSHGRTFEVELNELRFVIKVVGKPPSGL